VDPRGWGWGDDKTWKRVGLRGEGGGGWVDFVPYLS